jgi:hypothetical protein
VNPPSLGGPTLPEIRIGERMSESTDMSHLFLNSFGDLYAGKIAVALDRPLPTPQLLYAKLKMELPNDVEFEVWWNHFNDLITVVTAGRGSEMETVLPNMKMPRHMLVPYIDQLIERIKDVIISPE